MTPSKEELSARYRELPDHKLLDILYNKSEYRPEAIEAVVEELRVRKISTTTTTDFRNEKKETEGRSAENATIPLPLHLKMLFFFGWFFMPFLGTAYRLNYQEDGMLKKLRQSRIYSIAGFTALVVTVVMILAFKLSDLASIGVIVGLFCIFYILDEHLPVTKQ